MMKQSDHVWREHAVIVIPLPPRILSPNCPIGSFRGRMMRAAAAKKQKKMAKELADDLLRGTNPWTKASYEALFFHKTKRRRDDVNHLAMLKSAIDGIIEAGFLPDDDREHLHTTGAKFYVDAEYPRVEIHLWRES